MDGGKEFCRMEDYYEYNPELGEPRYGEIEVIQREIAAEGFDEWLGARETEDVEFQLAEMVKEDG
jgi:broad specificity phosphatase PhoE